MFTFGALLLGGGLAWLSWRGSGQDRASYDRSNLDPGVFLLLLHLRHDLRLIAFLLFGVIVMLGIVADRIG
jgi:hypothetical protein